MHQANRSVQLIDFTIETINRHGAGPGGLYDFKVQLPDCFSHAGLRAYLDVRTWSASRSEICGLNKAL